MSSHLRKTCMLPGLALACLLLGPSPATQAGGLRISYHGGKWAASARFGSPSWGFRCAPGLINRPCYFPGAYYGYNYGYGYGYPAYFYDYGYTGYIGEYYGVRYLSSSSSSPAPSKQAVSPTAEPAEAPTSAPAATDLDSELKTVLAEISGERTRKPATEAEMDPRIVVPEALANMVGLPDIQSTAFKKVRR